MGLFNTLRNEFIDIIEWPDMEAGILVHRFDRHDNEIKMNAKLVVRPGQRAVFVNEGQIADAFEPGTYTLTTQNIPILTTLKSWKYGFDSPFKAEVYFINTTEQLDRKWGTPNPVMLRDADFGIVRLRARGNYSYKIGITEEMISRFVGAQSDFDCDILEDQIRVKVISSFSDCIGEHKIPALDLAAKYDEISEFMIEKLKENFQRLGLELLSFALENISLPEEVQKAMDQRASMGAVGNLNNFSQYQAANALRDAAQNEGGSGNMMGMMMGAQMAGGVSNALNQKEQPAGQAPPPIPGGNKYFVALDGAQTGPFSISELKQKILAQSFTADSLVWMEGMDAWDKASAREDLKELFGAAPPPIPQ
ncbi:MAG: SPFH domain-containing protein [Victivallales bacterium]|nr:SPFH domain-containing protein [Victivallales bacterium]